MHHILRKTDLMVLIDGGGHQLRSFEQPALQSGVWYLVSFIELSAASKVIKAHTFKKPIPALLDLQKSVLIYRYGSSISKAVVFNLELNGTITTPHLYSGAMLSGTYNRQGDMFSLALRYVNAKVCTVFLEFEKTAPNLQTNASNGN